MKYSRQIGTVNEIYNIFIRDVTNTSSAGLANVVASSVSFGWFRSDMSAVSTGTCTTGTMGSYSVSSFVQCNSSNALGWYQFSAPDGMFVSGRSAALHMYGAPNMAPIPIEIELTRTDNQSYLSSQTVSSVLNLAAIADALLNRNVSAGSNTGRLVKEALYALRNKVDTGAGIVYETDDTTSSWAFTVSTQAGNPIVIIDPS